MASTFLPSQRGCGERGMVCAPHELDYSRLAKLLALLDSPVEGERIAALEACNRHLEAAGLRWRDIAAELPGSAEAQGDHAKGAAEVMRDGADVLTRWEVEFLIGITACEKLSARQRQILDRLNAKVNLARAA